LEKWGAGPGRPCPKRTQEKGAPFRCAWALRLGDGRAHGDEEAQRRGCRDVEAGAPADWEHAGGLEDVVDVQVQRAEALVEDARAWSFRACPWLRPWWVCAQEVASVLGWSRGRPCISEAMAR
jgi:hypothetical protein